MDHQALPQCAPVQILDPGKIVAHPQVVDPAEGRAAGIPGGFLQDALQIIVFVGSALAIFRPDMLIPGLRKHPYKLMCDLFHHPEQVIFIVDLLTQRNIIQDLQRHTAQNQVAKQLAQVITGRPDKGPLAIKDFHRIGAEENIGRVEIVMDQRLRFDHVDFFELQDFQHNLFIGEEHLHVFPNFRVDGFLGRIGKETIENKPFQQFPVLGVHKTADQVLFIDRVQEQIGGIEGHPAEERSHLPGKAGELLPAGKFKARQFHMRQVFQEKHGLLLIPGVNFRHRPGADSVPKLESLDLHFHARQRK